MEKKGSEKYYIIISLILGLILVAIVLYFLFHEYFTNEDINWQTCRQSIILRNTVPESNALVGMPIEKFKEQFPLKCKTEVVEIESTDANEIYKTIADKLVECWNLVGKGYDHIFPINIADERKDCLPCSRIHFSDKTQNHFKKLYSTTFFLGVYLLSHNLDGKEIPRDLWLIGGENENGPERLKIVEGTYASYLSNFRLYDKFKLADSNDWENDKNGIRSFGMKNRIDITKGDLIIGDYYYSDRDILEYFILNGEVYRYSYPFYAQVGVDTPLSCEIEGIPA